MVINAEGIESKCSEINDPILVEDIKWLEKLIKINKEHYEYFLNNYRDICIAEEKNKNRRCTVEDIDKKMPSKEFMYIRLAEALSILKKKYKKYGWIITRESAGFNKHCFYLKKIKTNSFWKSLFSKKPKKYTSILEEMEKKYSQNI